MVNFLTEIQKNNELRSLFGERELKIIEKQILGIKLKHRNLQLDELQEMDTDKIAEHKAKQAYSKINKTLFVWDSSVFISCLDNFPGPLIKWFFSTVKHGKICEIALHLKDKKITSKTTLTYYDGKILKHFYGIVEGTIPNKPKGSYGWDWDTIFIPKGYKKTYAEMKPDEFMALRSHKIALEKMRDFLRKR